MKARQPRAYPSKSRNSLRFPYLLMKGIQGEIFALTTICRQWYASFRIVRHRGLGEGPNDFVAPRPLAAALGFGARPRGKLTPASSDRRAARRAARLLPRDTKPGLPLLVR